MGDRRDEGMVQTKNFELADHILTLIIAKNEGIPLDQVESHVEKALIEANEKGLIKYETKSVKSV